MNNYKNRTESNISILSPEQYIAVCEASYKHPLGFLIRILMYTGITVVAPLMPNAAETRDLMPSFLMLIL